MKIIVCGCGRVLDKIDDGTHEPTYWAGECVECAENDGDYSLSSHWKGDSIRTKEGVEREKERAKVRGRRKG